MTTAEILRAGGSFPLRNGLRVWSEAAFHEQFKVGDLITGFGSRVVGRITAIGGKRFLYRVTRHDLEFEERVGTIRSFTGWAPVKTTCILKGSA